MQSEYLAMRAVKRRAVTAGVSLAFKEKQFMKGLDI
jgi:hypothetical protein